MIAAGMMRLEFHVVSKDKRTDLLSAPTRRSKAAGFRPSKELSSFKGVRHFWQYMSSEVINRSWVLQIRWAIVATLR